jgi:D-serine deaminase-like pyridoxal phosphate-dependent protein
MGNSPYAIADTSDIFSPGLIFFKDLIQHNLARTIEMAGSVSRLRLHAKTHKSPDIIALIRDAGVTKHKVATLAEAEMVAQVAPESDVFIAYPMVGPNCRRLAELIKRYPQTKFSITMDNVGAVDALADVLITAGVRCEVLLDVDVGQHRTGIAPGPEAQAVYERIASCSGLIPGGMHIYDGHNHQESFLERQASVMAQFEAAMKLRQALLEKGIAVPRVVVGGTPTFPVYTRLEVPGLECSPGTVLLHDQSYRGKFAELNAFVPAALLLTRVISRPTPTRVTFDLGYKAVASDPPAGKRLVLVDVPEYETVLQNEEHLVIEMPQASKFKPGDEALAIPTHVCPTVAMHQRAYVVEGGRVVGTWNITARDRVLGI